MEIYIDMSSGNSTYDLLYIPLVSHNGCLEENYLFNSETYDPFLSMLDTLPNSVMGNVRHIPAEFITKGNEYEPD